MLFQSLKHLYVHILGPHEIFGWIQTLQSTASGETLAHGTRAVYPVIGIQRRLNNVLFYYLFVFKRITLWQIH
jgi:hypothetical protein